MKKIFAVLLIVAMMISSGALAAEKLRVGMECDYTPYNWTQVDDSNGGVLIGDGSIDMGYAGGYDVMMAQRIAELTGRELEIVKIQWDGLIPALNAGQIDAVIAGMSPTEERKMSVDFTDVYYTSDIVIVVTKDGGYADATELSDFAGARLTAQQNTVHYTYFLPQIEGAQIQTAMPSFSDMLVALNAGAIDGYIAERPTGLSAQVAYDNVTFVSFEEGKGFVAENPEDMYVAIAIKQGQPEFLEELNAALAQISQEERDEMMTAACENQPLNN